MSSSFRHLYSIALACLITAALPAIAVAQDDEGEAPDRLVTLDYVTIARLGIQTAPIAVAQYRSETNGFGLVMPFDALAQTYSDLATAETSVQTSQAALNRSRSLFEAQVSVSRQTVETAQRQLTTDSAALSLAQRKAEAQWGQGAPWHNAAELNRILMRLSSGNLALIRVTFSTGVVGTMPPTSLKIERVDASAEAKSWTAKTVWRAPADPTIPGVSFFALVEGARELLPGERLLVSLPSDQAQQGVVIPARAVLIAEGSAWYYVAETQPLIIPMAPQTNFIRTSVDLSRPTADGYFMEGGDPNQIVVVEGAGLLLARETGAGEDDD